jgi:integrase
MRRDATLAELLESYVAEMTRTGVPTGSVRAVASRWRTWVLPVLGKLPCSEVSLAHWSELFGSALAGGASEQTIRYLAAAVGSVTAYGIRSGWFDANADPWGPQSHRRAVVQRACKLAARRSGRGGRGLIDIATCPGWDDMAAYAEALERIWPGWGGAFVWLSAGTGCRIAEAAAWRVGDWDLARRTVRVERQLDRHRPWPATTAPKSGRARATIVWSWLVPMAADVLAAAHEDPDGSGNPFLFPRRDTRIRWWLDRLGEMCRRARVDAGWRWKSHHWTRHFFATYCLASPDMGGYGFDLAAVASWMGHSDTSVLTGTYRWSPAGAEVVAAAVTERCPRPDLFRGGA